MSTWVRKLVDPRQETSLSAFLRRKRFRLFRELVDALPKPVSILDVGGEQRFWEVMGAAEDKNFSITILNTLPLEITNPFLCGVRGDATDLREFPAQSFDIVFSNSVIEHLETYDRQQRMAEEVRRVGKRYFIQTPNKRFPLEPHFLVPFFQYLPLAWRVAMVQRWALGWYPRTKDRQAAIELICSHRLLKIAELRLLFPDGKLFEERVLGLVKSFVVYGPER